MSPNVDLEPFARASRDYFRRRGELVLASRARHGTPDGRPVDRWQLRDEPFEATVVRYQQAGEAWRAGASAALEAGVDPLEVKQVSERARRLVFEGEFMLPAGAAGEARGALERRA